MEYIDCKEQNIYWEQVESSSKRPHRVKHSFNLYGQESRTGQCKLNLINFKQLLQFLVINYDTRCNVAIVNLHIVVG